MLSEVPISIEKASVPAAFRRSACDLTFSEFCRVDMRPFALLPARTFAPFRALPWAMAWAVLSPTSVNAINIALTVAVIFRLYCFIAILLFELLFCRVATRQVESVSHRPRKSIQLWTASSLITGAGRENMSRIFRGGEKSKRKVCNFWQSAPVAAMQGSFRAEV
jgi:hypothetical protein